MADVWDPFHHELRHWQAEGRVARLWLRDDDAVENSDALDRLFDLTARFGVPVLLAAIPAFATVALADRVRDLPHVSVGQHGYAHANHAAPGAKAAELGADRPLDDVLRDLAIGHDRLAALFGSDFKLVLVPPWNRIAPTLSRHLSRLGFQALSTFGPEPADETPDLLIRNCHVDIIDWKATRRGHPPEKSVRDLVEALALARAAEERPIGILTHHLVHGEAAWSFLEGLLARTDGHPAVRWVPFDALGRGSADGTGGDDPRR